jgi:hypothetical protein
MLVASVAVANEVDRRVGWCGVLNRIADARELLVPDASDGAPAQGNFKYLGGGL